jgi:hypothetical protein
MWIVSRYEFRFVKVKRIAKVDDLISAPFVEFLSLHILDSRSLAKNADAANALNIGSEMDQNLRQKIEDPIVFRYLPTGSESGLGVMVHGVETPT